MVFDDKLADSLGFLGKDNLRPDEFLGGEKTKRKHISDCSVNQ